MAKKQATNDTSSVKTQTFTKGLIKDISDSYFPDDSWGHAVNAVNVTTDGDIGTLSNEQSNTPCGSVPNLPNEAPFQIIGKIHLYEAQWVLFATNGTTSQVGWYNENNCNYCTIVKDPCLDFDVNHLITGKSKKNFDCSWQIYWADGKNPDRSMNIGNPDTWQCIPQDLQDQVPWPGVPYLEKCDYVDPILPDCTEPDCVAEGCLECQLIQPLQLDCNKIRLVRLIKQPCVTVKKGISGGNMPNGSYYVVIAYSINQQRVTDYFSPSNIQPIFAHSNLAGSLDITINDLDREFYSEFELVVVYTVNQQTVAKQVGFYSTHSGSITLDSIDITTPSIPLELIPVRTTTYEKSEQISQINNYLVRMSPTTGFDFNYQPLANRIETKWVAIEYPVDYYRNGGNRTSYLRDEIYAFWIRWVYDTGDKTPSYHIPGRPPQEDISLLCPDLNVCDLENVKGYQDNIFNDSCLYDVYNTGYVTENLIQQGTTYTLEDGGVVVAKGRMGYWQSTERYPDTKAPIWNTSANFWSSYSCQGLAYGEAEVDLCGQYIRHHKMPDNKCVPHFKSNNIIKPRHFYSDVEKIVILGVEFENIGFPVDNDGIPIPGIVGYEILRGSREGNKSIIAKGMLNHMREYDIYEGRATYYDPVPEIKGYGLYQNYPYNYLGVDPSLQSNQILIGTECVTPSPYESLDRVSTNKFTFHSPDFQFREPFLAEKELKVYGEIFGDVDGNYDDVPGHPEHKVLSNFSVMIAAFAGLGIAALSILGKKTSNNKSAQAFNLGDLNLNGLNATTSGGTLTTADGPVIQTVPGYFTFDPVNSEIEVPADSGSPIPSQNQLSLSNAGQAAGTNVAESTLAAIASILGFPDAIYTAQAANWTATVTNPANKIKGFIGPGFETTLELSPSKVTSGIGGVGANIANFLYYWSQGTDSVINFIEAWVPFEQYALMYRSHGYYTQFSPSIFCQPNYQRRLLNQIFYLDANIQNFSGTHVGPPIESRQYTINNLFRNKCVVLEINGDLNISNDPNIPLKFFKENSPYTGTCLYNPPSTLAGNAPEILPDNSLQILQTLNNTTEYSSIQGPNQNWYTNYTLPFSTRTRALYGAVKYRNRNQYGQLELVRQIIASDCPILINRFPDPEQEICSFDIKYNSGVIFGGDTYIGRYTEKNKFFYFYDWLYEQPDGTPLDYTLKPMIPYPTYWADLTGFDLGKMITNLTTLSFIVDPTGAGGRIFPSQYHNFDKLCTLPANNPNNTQYNPFTIGLGVSQDGLFNVMNSFFYLFNTGVRDFIVESEINIDLRDWDELPEQRFYDPYRYTDLEALFDTAIIKADNYYKYDYSLSVARIFNSFISWGNMQPRYYDPLIAETCYQYYPNRLLYSLPAELEQVKDNWYAYLANNYKDFQSKPNSINAINKNGAMITFEYDGPLMYQGVDTLETELNTKITIGDGGLFSQPGQSVVNADVSYEYGSCQDKFSVLSTPYGIFYISQNQSKVFQFAGSLKEISAVNMRYWFDKYLRYRILLDFPDFPLTDNPVSGVGCQTIYDNNDQIVYFTKKDYKLRTEYKGRVTFTELDPDTEQVINRFTLDEMTYFYLNDDLFNTVFEDASWTISYDPKAESWISFHDWHPDLLLPARNNFISVRNNGLWRHNFVTNSYCNFYGVDYKFEVEYPVSTGQAVNTIRSLEYILEPYIYDADGIDQYNVIDWNFNNAVIYNIEQVSGVLNLNMTPKNDVIGRLQYPIVNPTSIDIACSKEENKYRFNQFWDITDDRGEFPTPTGFAQRPIWDTAANGYDRILNPANLNYDKSPLQRKKFRHYVNYVVLSRINRGDDPRNVQMILKITNTKNLYSPR